MFKFWKVGVGQASLAKAVHQVQQDSKLLLREDRQFVGETRDCDPTMCARVLQSHKYFPFSKSFGTENEMYFPAGRTLLQRSAALNSSLSTRSGSPGGILSDRT